MRLFIAHSNSPYLTGVDTSDWSAESGLPTLPSTGQAVLPLFTKGALAIGNSNSPRFRVIDLDGYADIQTHAMSGTVLALAAPSGEEWVVIGGTASPYLHLLDTSDWSLSSPAALVPSTVNALDVHPDGDYIGVAHAQSPYFTVISKASWSEVFAASVLSTSGSGVSFSPDGTLVAISTQTSASNNVVIYKVADWSVETTLSLNGTAQDVRFSPDGQYLACGRSFGTGYQVFRTSDWGEEDVDSVSSTANELRFDPTGTMLAIAHSSSPYYSVRNVGTWDDAIDVSLPATIPSTGQAACWVPDHWGTLDSGIVAPFSALDGEFSAADVVGTLSTSSPAPTTDMDGAVATLVEGDMATVSPAPTSAMDGSLEIRGDMATISPVPLSALTGFPGLEMTSTMGMSTAASEFRLGFTFPPSVMEMEDSHTMGMALLFISRMSTTSSLEVGLKGGFSVSDAMGMASAMSIGDVLSFMDAMNMDGSAAIQYIEVLQFIASMSMDSEADFNTKLAINLASAMTMRTIMAYGEDIDLASTMTMTSIFERNFSAVLDALDGMDMVTTMGTNLSAQLLFFSTAEMTSEMETQAKLQLEFEELMGSMAMLKLGDDVYEGWVLSADDKAYSSYDNYPFDSIATFAGKPYGIAEDGLYLLEGDDDAGEPIKAAVRTGLMHLGARQLKDAKSVYLGYTSEGRLVLKVVTTGGGKKREDWYRMKHSSAPDMRTGRFTIQRGLRSTYWQFELCNQDGADFEVDDVTLVYNLLTRRIR